MISAEEQKKVIALVKQTKELILKEMNNEEVMVKGAFPDRGRKRKPGTFQRKNLLDSGSY